MKKLMLLGMMMLIALTTIASAANVTYDFDSCSNLTGCNLSEVGYNSGLGLSYITTLGSDSVLYFNGARHTSSPYEPYVLQFLEVPDNATYLEFMVRPADSNYAEFGLSFLANDTNVQNPWTGISFANTDYSNKALISYDFDGSATEDSCSKLVVGAWNKVKIIMNEDQSLEYYLNDTLDCSINWSYQSYNVVNLGDLAFIRTTTGDTSPNIYFDNITFSDEIGSLEQPTEEEVLPITKDGYEYDFENDCSVDDLECHGLREIGYNKGYNQSYITSFNNNKVLYYNGRRGGAPYYYYLLQFLYVPENATKITYSVYPIDGSYAEVRMTHRLNNTGLQFSEASFIDIYNTDYYNRVDLAIRTNATTISNNSCSKYTAGTWNDIMLIIDYQNKTLE